MDTFLYHTKMFVLLIDLGGRVVGTDEWVLGNNTTAATLWSNARIPQSGW
ncbi:MAG: hypothetical protein FWF81_05260 [Defluviitaleaceae bacterium]|nr:hypothetical protein [Defluviitaleaceae bacterium]